MKKQISRLFVAASIVVLAASCIDDDMIDRVDFRNYYKTETDARTAINGVYSTLYAFNYHKWNWVIAHPCFEDCMYATGGAANQLSMNAIGGNTSDLTNPWTALYGAINAANAVIRYVPEIEFKNENDRSRGSLPRPIFCVDSTITTWCAFMRVRAGFPCIRSPWRRCRTYITGIRR